MPDHAELGETEGDEDVNAVKDDQVADRAVGHDHQDQGADTHDQDAIDGHQPVGEQGKALGDPMVGSHAGQNARAVKEAGLGGDEEDRGFGN